MPFKRAFGLGVLKVSLCTYCVFGFFGAFSGFFKG